MINTILFFITNHLYKGRITYERVKQIIASYGFVLFEYDLSAENEELELLQSFNLMNYAEVMPCITYILDAQHKYVFIRSGETETDKINMLLHEAGHIYNEHFATEELVHNTPYTKERQANMFSSMLLVLNRICRVFPYIFVSSLIVSIVLVAMTDKLPTPNNSFNVVYYTQSGEVYHLFEDCYYLRSAVVISGTVESCGKNRICSACKLRSED